MQTLVLIRHALAEDRQQWRGSDDARRPLTDAGRRQAQRIAKIVAGEIERLPGEDGVVVSLRSSPALRCIDTLHPLAQKIGLAIDVDGNLNEGRDIAPPSPRDSGVHVLCAHGDNIPWLLEALRIKWEQQCRKGSIWIIQRDGRGKTLAANYHSVPKD